MVKTTYFSTVLIIFFDRESESAETALFRSNPGELRVCRVCGAAPP